MCVCVSFSDMQHTCQLDHQLSIWVPLWIVKLFMVFFPHPRLDLVIVTGYLTQGKFVPIIFASMLIVVALFKNVDLKSGDIGITRS